MACYVGYLLPRRHYLLGAFEFPPYNRSPPSVPRGATWGVVRLRTRSAGSAGRFLVHCMQLLPRRSCRSHETQKMLNVTAEAPAVLPFQVVVSSRLG